MRKIVQTVYSILHLSYCDHTASNVVSMLGQRRRRWPNIETTFDQRVGRLQSL